MRSAALAVVFVVSWGCYRPTVATGVPCAESGDCPDHQVCDPATRTCFATGAIDAPSAGDAAGDAVDAFVACTPADCVDPARPICDPTSGACRGCAADRECASDVCVESTGTCVDEAAAIYIAPNGGGIAASNGCARATPCRAGVISQLISASRHVVKVADGTYTATLTIAPSTTGFVTVVSGEDLAAAGATFASVNPTSMELDAPTLLEGVTLTASSGIAIAAAADLTANRIAITQAKQHGIQLASGAGAHVALVDATIHGAAGAAIDAPNGGELVASRCVFAGDGAGIVAANARVVVDDTIIASDLGTGGFGIGGVQLTSPLAGTRFDFVTIVTTTSIGTASAINANAPVELANSIVVGGGTSPIAASVSATYTMFDHAPAPSGLGNFVGAPAFASGTYHLTAASDARGKAAALAIYPRDVDGEARPQGGAADVGADEIP